MCSLARHTHGDVITIGTRSQMEADTIPAEVRSDWKVAGWFPIAAFHRRYIANSLLGLFGMFKALEASFIAASTKVSDPFVSALLLEAYRFL